jgi:predicted kinase
MKSKVILLIGHPLVGKSTWIKNNYPQTKVISRDDIVLELSNSQNYNDSFSSVDQKLVDRILTQRMISAGSINEDVIIDMTHMTSKRRKSNLLKFPNFHKIAVVFPHLSDEEIRQRNEVRTLTEGKSIPVSVIKDMVSQFEVPTKSEGFDDIIFL